MSRRIPPVILYGTLLEGGLGLLAWGLGWLLDQPALANLHWRPGDLALALAATLPMLLIFVLFLRLPFGPFVRIQRFVDEFLRPLFVPCTLVELAVLSLAAGIGEEMLFRGVLQGVFSHWWGPWPGVLAASVVFGLLHLITPTYAVMATLLGVYLGGCFLASDNLLVVIVAHALYDFVALVYLVRSAPPAGGHESCYPPTPSAER